MFPEAVRAVRELRPKAFIVENVKGLLRTQFKDYFRYVRLQLAFPNIVQRRETWKQHLWRLEGHAPRKDADYNVAFKLLNAANYGVPQKRERVFIVGFRADLGIEWSFPEETHSQDALLISQFVEAEYWQRHGIPKRARPGPWPRVAGRILQLCQRDLEAQDKLPWLTVRDAISDLPDPVRNRDKGVPNHVFNPGARSYPGHTGSPIDGVAKTLKAGDHGVPGGENMVAWADGSVRYFTVREAARLQTFPDDYVFRGAWSEAMRQLGNAVPVKLAEAVARSVSRALAREATPKRRRAIQREAGISITA
jgi:DNA (cytosine-5)-methyltransferase 1